MMHRLATNYAINYCNWTPIVKVIVENVVTCFFGTQCINITKWFKGLTMFSRYDRVENAI